jgi:hypothetical protein
MLAFAEYRSEIERVTDRPHTAFDAGPEFGQKI